MWALFKFAIRFLLLLVFTLAMLLSALFSTASSTFNPAIQIVKASSEITEAFSATSLASAITIPSAITLVAEFLFVGSLILASAMLFWKKGEANGSKALKICHKFKNKVMRSIADNTSNELNNNDIKEEVTRDEVINVDNLAFENLNNDRNEQIEDAELEKKMREILSTAFSDLSPHTLQAFIDCMSLPKIVSDSAPPNYKTVLMQHFTALAIKMRIKKVVDIGKAFTSILHHPTLEISEQLRAKLVGYINDIKINQYFTLLNETIFPTSYWSRFTKNISNTVYWLATIVTVPGEISLSAFSLLLPFSRVPGLSQNIGLLSSIALTAAILSSGMTFAMLYDNHTVKKNNELSDTLNQKASFFKKFSPKYAAIVYAAISSTMGSIFGDFLVADTAIALLFGSTYDEYGIWKDLFIGTVYLMLVAIGYRKWLGTLNQMDEAFNSSPNIFYLIKTPENALVKFRDYSVPIEKAISAGLATFTQMYKLTGSQIIALTFMLNSSIATLIQVPAVNRRAAQQHDPQVLLANKIFFDILRTAFRELAFNQLAQSPEQLELASLKVELLDPNTLTTKQLKEEAKFISAFEQDLAKKLTKSRSSNPKLPTPKALNQEPDTAKSLCQKLTNPKLLCQTFINSKNKKEESWQFTFFDESLKIKRSKSQSIYTNTNSSLDSPALIV